MGGYIPSMEALKPLVMSTGSCIKFRCGVECGLILPVLQIPMELFIEIRVEGVNEGVKSLIESAD